MTLTALAHAIRELPTRDQAKLFDRLGPSLEDYLLRKIAQYRFSKPSAKRIPWEDLKP